MQSPCESAELGLSWRGEADRLQSTGAQSAGGNCVESGTLVYSGVILPTVASQPPGDSVSHSEGFFFVSVDERILHLVQLLYSGGSQAHPLGVAFEPPGDS